MWINKSLSSLTRVTALGLALSLCTAMSGYASVSIPPVTIVGSLQTLEGFELTTGELRFEFAPNGSGVTVSVDAVVGSFGGGLNFYAYIPIHAAPLPAGINAVELGAGKTYTARAYYSDQEIVETQIQTPYTPVQGSTLGPVVYIVDPQGPALSVSGDIDFGYVPVGSTLEDNFEIVNVGAETITGAARLETGNQFNLREGGGPVGLIPFNLEPGESQAMIVEFAPTVVNSRLTDTFEILSNADEITRTLLGNSSSENPTPTPTPPPALFQLEIDAPASVTGVIGSTLEIEVSVNLISALDPIEGWYLGICTGDSTVCGIREIQVGEAVVGTEVFDIEVETESAVCSGMEGELAILLDPNFDPPLSPSQLPHELMKVTLEFAFADQPGESECLIDFVDGLQLTSVLSPTLNLTGSNFLRIGGLPFGATHGLEMSGASIEVVTIGPETPTPTQTPTMAVTPTATPTPTRTPVPTLNLEYDIEPEFPDGIVNALDLLRWVDVIGQKTADSQILFDFARFWTRTSSVLSNTAQYEVVFEGTWSEESHPTDFPSDAHFSGLIGGIHNSSVVFWKEGGLAGPGIETMAETGSKAFIAQEVNVAITAGRAATLLSGGAISPTPDSASIQFELNQAYPLVTLVSKISPSPDWFVGVSGVSLSVNGVWAEELTIPLQPIDAGTDSGSNYTSPDEDTLPQESIREIEVSPFRIGDSVPSLGTFIFRRID